MLTALCSSGLGVGDDPSGFDVGEDSWAWSPSPSTLPSPKRKHASTRSVRNGRGMPPSASAAADGAPLTLGRIGGTGIAGREKKAATSFSSKMATFFGRSSGTTPPTGMAQGSPRSSSVHLGGGFQEAFAVGAEVAGRRGSDGDLEIWGGRRRDGKGSRASVERLQTLALDLESSAPGAVMGASDTGSEASGPGADDSGLVKLDLSSVEALQDALQRGGLLPREKDDAMDSTHGVQAERDLSVARVTHGKGTSRGRLEEEGSQLWRNGGVFKAGRGARGRRKYDDGFDGDDDDPSVHGSSRSLAGSSLHGGAEVLPMRYELALSRRLFRLSRGVTKLRVIRGSVPANTPAPERPVELQIFPALQDLRLEGIPLEHVQGVFALRLQLKALRFENAPLVSLLALLAPFSSTDGRMVTSPSIRTSPTGIFTGFGSFPRVAGDNGGVDTRKRVDRASELGSSEASEVTYSEAFRRNGMGDVGPGAGDVKDGRGAGETGGENVSRGEGGFEEGFEEGSALPYRVPSPLVPTSWMNDVVEANSNRSDGPSGKDFSDDRRSDRRAPSIDTAPPSPGFSSLHGHMRLTRTRSSSAGADLERPPFSSVSFVVERAAAHPRDRSSTGDDHRTRRSMAKTENLRLARSAGIVTGELNKRVRSGSGYGRGKAGSLAPTWEAPDFDGRNSGEVGELRLRLGTGTPELRWSLLEDLSVCRCGIRELDPSLRLLPRVRRLSLAHNHLSRIDFFQDCASLEELDLSFNRIESVENVSSVLGNVSALKLEGNRIENTSGLERLFSLEEIDISRNRIRGLENAARLSALPLLRGVALQGNPLEAEERKTYRVTVLSLLHEGRGTELHKAVALSGVGGMGATLGIGDSGVNSHLSETGTIALDGRFPSRKELGELIRLQFASAIEASPVQPRSNGPSSTRRHASIRGRSKVDGFTVADSNLHSHAILSDDTTGVVSRRRPRRQRRRRRKSGPVGIVPASRDTERGGGLEISEEPFFEAGVGLSRQHVWQRPLSEGSSGSSQGSVVKGSSSSPPADAMAAALSENVGGSPAFILPAWSMDDKPADIGTRRPLDRRRDQRGHDSEALPGGSVWGTSGDVAVANPLVDVDGEHTRSVPSQDAGATTARTDGAAATAREWLDMRDSSGSPPTERSRGGSAEGRMERHARDRRRGTRSVVIEEPGSAAAAGSGVAAAGPMPSSHGATVSGAGLRPPSLSFGSLALPTDNAEGLGEGLGEGYSRQERAREDAAPVKASVVERNPEAVPEVDDVNDRIEETTPLTKKGDIDERESEGSVSSDERSEDHEEEELVRGLWRRAPTVTAVRDKLFPYREYKNEPSRASRDMETAKDDNVINLAPSGSSLPRPSSAQSAISMVSDMVSTAAAVALPLGGEGDTTGHRKKDLAGDTASGVDNNGIAPGWEASLLEGGGIDEDEGKAASNGPARGDPADHSTPLLRPSVLGEADEHEDEERGQSLQEAQSADSSRLFEPLAEKESLPLMEGTLSNDDDAIASAGAGSVGVDGCTIQLSAESDGDGDGVSSSRSADQTKPVRDDNRESDVGVGDDDDDDDDQGQHTKGEAEKRGEEKRVATLTGPAVEEAGIASGIVEEEEEAVKDEIMGDGAQESEALLRADDGTAVMREGVMPSKDEADCVSEEGLIATEDRGSAAALAPPTNVDGADDAASSADERADGDGECSPYRGDAAYASLLIAEHLELFFRQQVFNGSAPYLSYDDSTDLPRAMHAYREASKHRTNDRVVAVFRETALPCLPETSWLSVRPTIPSRSFRDRVTGGGFSGSGEGALETCGRRLAENLAATGMAQTVHRRGLQGEAKGVTMGEVACVVVATNLSVFVLDGSLLTKESLFLEAPRPKVLLVVPLASFERTTIGFRLQKLELHFGQSFLNRSSITADVSQNRPTAKTAVNAVAVVVVASSGAVTSSGLEHVGDFGGNPSSSLPRMASGETNSGEADERVSVVLLTRDRARTINLLQTLEPLATKARRALGIPDTVVENRDEATLEAIATALPRLRASATRKLTPRVLIGLPDKPSPVQSQKVGLFDRLEKWADGLAASRTQGNVSAAGGSGLGVTVGDQDVVVHDKASGTGSGVRGQQRPANTSTDEMNSTSSGSRSQPREPELQGKEGMLPGVDGGLPSPSPARISPDRPADGTKRVLNGGRIGSDVSANDGAVVEWRQEADNGAAVVFQLLMQRWELRPWVVVPRTLVATKEQVALMDEDHSCISWSSAKPSVRRSAPPSPPGWSTAAPPPPRQHPSFVDNRSSPMASTTKRGIISGGDDVEGGGDAESGMGPAAEGAGVTAEMVCVDAADLADVIGVHQEESAPEQVMIELKGEKVFDPQRQWRLQCRTRASAETVASTLLRLSRERIKQRQELSWWRR